MSSRLSARAKLQEHQSVIQSTDNTVLLMKKSHRPWLTCTFWDGTAELDRRSKVSHCVILITLRTAYLCFISVYIRF